MATWLITGCSTDLGRALASTALDRGETVVVTARDAARVEDLARPHPDTALALSLDVTDHAQRRDVVRDAQERFGTIDARRSATMPALWAPVARATLQETATSVVTLARAAQAIITAVQSPGTPLMLVLGSDVLTWFRDAMKKLNADVDAWEQTSLSTSFPG